jgi:hypothetical protein
VGGPPPGLVNQGLPSQPAQLLAATSAQVAELRRQLEAGRREVAGLHARLADTARQRDEAREQLAVERALREQLAAGVSDAATGRPQLDESWRGLAEALKEQLIKVRGCDWVFAPKPTRTGGTSESRRAECSSPMRHAWWHEHCPHKQLFGSAPRPRPPGLPRP